MRCCAAASCRSKTASITAAVTTARLAAGGADSGKNADRKDFNFLGEIKQKQALRQAKVRVSPSCLFACGREGCSF